MNPHFPNLAGHNDPDPICRAELEAAGVPARLYSSLRSKGEVKSATIGELGPWGFHRAWRYWIVESNFGMPPADAELLHASSGREVRVHGHCGCPSPAEWCNGFAVGLYHVDTPAGLKALADTIKNVIQRSKTMRNGER